MQEIDDILNSKRKEPKTFHPVKDRSGQAWFPGNEAASLVVQLRHIWEDISEIHKIYEKQTDEYVRKLLLKYVVIELRSLVEVFDRLQAIVMKTSIFDPNERQGWREITQEEHDQAKSLLKEYSKAKSSSIKSIIGIRNEVGAHRGNLDWTEVMKFWDKIEPDTVNPLIDVFPRVFDYIKSLDLYEWNKTLENGVHCFIGAQLRPEYFKYTEADEEI
ncbi:hypothetical protein [Sessilibacter corallicola]|uniref:HEPN AbiU2-like domain-containing protein n=1 Tax=Sessilibacter corallicola TaxID=2904075 RepID=A0ABQ0ACN5_9GAMM